jgi:predicted RNA binding protein YcfA (HicA-like mRNA interferase family)
MPPKVRILEKQLKKAGFTRLPGKGSHRKFVHATGARLTLSGKPAADALPYQIKDVKHALALVKK